jgi:hypothetical protein
MKMNRIEEGMGKKEDTSSQFSEFKISTPSNLGVK